MGQALRGPPGRGRHRGAGERSTPLDRPGRRRRRRPGTLFVSTSASDCSNLIGDHLLGNHDDFGTPLPEALRQALDECLRQMNGAGHLAQPREHAGSAPTRAKRSTLPLIHPWRWRNGGGSRSPSCAVISCPTGARAGAKPRPSSGCRCSRRGPARLPARDVEPFLPEARWEGRGAALRHGAGLPRCLGLDVRSEMPHLVALLGAPRATSADRSGPSATNRRRRR
jgi:hypothetical protein